MDLVVAQCFPFVRSAGLTGCLSADGQSQNIADLTTLYEVIGTVFGGDGQQTFGLPLVPPLQTTTSPIGQVVVTQGPFPVAMVGYLGEVRLWPSPVPPRNWLPCDGSTLSPTTYEDLFTVLGVSFGGDGENGFQLPNLAPPAAGLQYIICSQGVYPSQLSSRPQLDYFLGSIALFAFPQLPSSFWSLADPRSLGIAQYPALYSLFGTEFGPLQGNDFPLPQITPLTSAGSDGLVYFATTSAGVYPPLS